LNKLNKNGKIKTEDIKNKFNIHRATAFKDLKALINQDKIIKKGGGNNVWYELK
jgi:DeoR/GlpR family transcriptional regulator of sugar metabolism